MWIWPNLLSEKYGVNSPPRWIFRLIFHLGGCVKVTLTLNKSPTIRGSTKMEMGKSSQANLKKKGFYILSWKKKKNVNHIFFIFFCLSTHVSICVTTSQGQPARQAKQLQFGFDKTRKMCVESGRWSGEHLPQCSSIGLKSKGRDEGLEENMQSHVERTRHTSRIGSKRLHSPFVLLYLKGRELRKIFKLGGRNKERRKECE